MINKMKRLAIIGSGELGQQVAHFAKETGKFIVVGWFDDYQIKGTIIGGYPILGKNKEILNFFNETFDCLFIAIGYNHLLVKKEIFLNFKNVIPFATIIHDSAIVDKTAKIGEGVIIYPGAILDKEVEIQDNVLINLGCVISHNTHVGAHSFIAPAVCIAGFVCIEELCFIGINSTIIDNIKVLSNCIIGANTTVTKNITIQGKYVGTPAKLIN